MKQEKWLPQFDYLRILAAFSVVMIHASAILWYQEDQHTSLWLTANAYNTLSRFGVPVFFMISGALLLSPERELTAKTLWRRHILRLAIIYAVWSCVYGLNAYLRPFPDAFSIKDMIKSILNGSYHLWFLPAIMALYALTPILRKWLSACEEKDVEYFLSLFVLFQIVRTTLAAFLRTTEVLTRLDDLNYLNIVCTFAGYYILGHYLQTYGLPEKCNKVLFIGLPIFCALNVVLSTFAIWHKGPRSADFANTFGLFTFLTSVALFQLFSSLFKEKSSRPKSIIRGISADTLGIYMIHLIIINLPFMHVIYESLPPILSIPVVAISTFLISLLCSSVLRRIPVVGKFIC